MREHEGNYHLCAPFESQVNPYVVLVVIPPPDDHKLSGRGKKRKRGPESFRENKKLYRRAGFEGRLRHDLDRAKSDKSGEGYRYGYRLMWRGAPDTMRRLKMPKVGSFEKNNGHDGEIWGWKRECTMTDHKAKQILLACAQSGELSIPMMTAVRKSMAYAWQLLGKDGDTDNFPSIKRVWKAVKTSELPSNPQNTTLPQMIPTPEQLKAAFNSTWNPTRKLSLLESVVGRRAASDIFLAGARSKEDVDRLKKSRTHQLDYAGGWMRTRFKGGRAKLIGQKKGTREWWTWNTCWCPGGVHKRINPRARYSIGPDGNPRDGKVPFEERCILAGWEFTSLFEKNKSKLRRYPNVVKNGKYGKSNVGPVVELAIAWLLDQGVGDPDKPFDTNSGRKSLAGLLTHLNVIFEEGFEFHADLPATWRDHYQPECIMHDKGFRRRKQSTNPAVATRALRRFGQFFGLGASEPVRQLTLSERQNHILLRHHGYAKEADQLLMGLHPHPTLSTPVVAEHPVTLKRDILEPSNGVALQRLTNTVLDEAMAKGLAESDTVKPESVKREPTQDEEKEPR